MSIDLDKELQNLRAEHDALLAEESGPPPVPTWQQLQDSGAVVSLERQVSRRSILGHLKRANQIRQKELEIAQYERRLEPLHAEQEAAYPALEAKRAELTQLQQRVNVMGGEFSQRLYKIQEFERRVRLLHKEIAELREVGNG